MSETAQYQLVIHRAAQKELAGVTGDTSSELLTKLKSLKVLPNPLDQDYCEQLTNHENIFRVKVGNYRALCTLDKPTVYVLLIAPRARVYDRIDTAKERFNGR